MEIKPIQKEDYSQLAAIYLEGIQTGHATFEKEPPAWELWDSNHLSSCRIAAFENMEMLGWAALSPVSSRCVYAGVGEISIYISKKHQGKGIGKILLQHLIDQSEKEGIWTLQSGIFPENIGSIELHKRCGFREIGYREKIGSMDGIWRDSIIMERRSKRVGI